MGPIRLIVTLLVEVTSPHLFQWCFGPNLVGLPKKNQQKHQENHPNDVIIIGGFTYFWNFLGEDFHPCWRLAHIFQMGWGSKKPPSSWERILQSCWAASCHGSKVVAYMVLLAAWPDTDLDHEDKTRGFCRVFLKLWSGWRVGTEPDWKHTHTHTHTWYTDTWTLFYLKGEKRRLLHYWRVWGWHYGKSWGSGFQCPETGCWRWN